MNPFMYGKIVTGKHFFDRVDELKRILDTLEGGNNLVLYAPRRYGKSSLVKRAFCGSNFSPEVSVEELFFHSFQP